MLEILQDLENYRAHISQIHDKVQSSRLLQFPEVMQNLKLIIEFSDCILQAEDLLNYKIIIDDDPVRAKQAELT